MPSLTSPGSLAANALAAVARQLTSGIVQLVTLVVIARVYGPEGSGIYAMAMLLPTLLVAFLNLGIGAANVYFLGSSQFGLYVVWRANIRLLLWISLVGVLFGISILTWFSDYLFAGVSPELLVISLLNFPLLVCLSFVLSIFQGLQQFRNFNFILLLQAFITLALVLLLALLNGDRLDWLLFAYLLATLVTVSSAYRILAVQLRGDCDLAQVSRYSKAALIYGYKAHLSNILSFVNYKADIFLVNFFIGPAAVGIYVIAIQIAERLWLLSQAVSTVLLPRLSQLAGDEVGRSRLTPFVSRWVLLVTAIASVVLGIVSYPLILFIFGPDYVQATWPLLLLLPGIVIGAASRILANDLAARGRPDLNMYTSWVTVIINVGGNVLLIVPFGLAGAAIATSVAYTVNAIMRAVMYSRFTGSFMRHSFIVRSEDFQVLRKAIADLRS